MLRSFILQLLKLGYPFFRRILPYQVYTYLSAGAMNTVLNIVLFMFCYHRLMAYSMAVEISTTISLAVTIFTGYWLQKNFVFGNADNERNQDNKQLVKYTLVALQGQISAYILTKAMILLLLLSPSIAYILTTILMLTLNYFLQKYFTFRKRKQFS